MPVDVGATETYPSAVPGPAGGDPRTAPSVRQMGTPLASRTRFLYNRLKALLGDYKQITFVDTANDEFTCVGHGLANGDPVRFEALNGILLSPVLPNPLDAAVIYYALVTGADTFKVEVSLGAGPLNITSAGVADQYVIKVEDSFSKLFTKAAGSAPAGTLRSIIAALYAEVARRPWANPMPLIWPAQAANWQYGGVAGGPFFAPLVENIATAGAHFVYALDLPHGKTISTASVRFKGKAGHGLNMPAPGSRAQFTLAYNNDGLEENYFIISQGESAETLAAGYEVYHSITASGTGHVVDSANQYFLIVYAESGANYLAGGRFCRPKVVMA